MADDISLRDTIKAAMNPEPEPAPAEGIIAPEPQIAVEPEAKAAPEPAEEGDTKGPVRGPDGKFAKAEEVGQTITPVVEQSAAQEPAQQTIPVPPGLAAPLKAKWSELPEDWRQAFQKQEDSFKVVREEWQPKAERLNRLDEVIAPRREKLTINGVDEATWISRLAAAEDVLERNPAEGLLYLARTYGVGPQQLVQYLSGPQAAQLPQYPPEFQTLMNEVQTLRQQVTQQPQLLAEQAQRAEVQREVDAFAKNPANLYWENVKGRVAALLSSPEYTERNAPIGELLASAYQEAVWSHPETRDLMLAEQQAKAAKAAPAPSPQAKAAQAKQAAGSVTGAPGPGQAAGAPSGNLRETIRAALQEASGGV
jgi:hypothetical protein